MLHGRMNRTIPTRITRDHARAADELAAPGQSRTGVVAEALAIGLAELRRRRDAVAGSIATPATPSELR